VATASLTSPRIPAALVLYTVSVTAHKDAAQRGAAFGGHRISQDGAPKSLRDQAMPNASPKAIAIAAPMTVIMKFTTSFVSHAKRP